MNKFTLLVAAAVATSAQAQMTPVSRSSWVYAWEHTITLGHEEGFVSDERSSAGFEPINWNIGAGGYTAIQQSAITPAAIDVVARAYGTPASALGYGSAISTQTIVFDIGAISTFRLEGGTARFIGEGRMTLTGPGVDILASVEGFQQTPFLFEGTLLAGRYTFEVYCSADWGSVDAHLTVVPTPGTIVLCGGATTLWLVRRRRAGG
ncbi:MAG: hypothetical protein AABZ53_10150 [Planctomycetota bacterium]